MNQNNLGYIVSFSFVGLVLGIVWLLTRLFNINKELSRKLVHISMSHWIIFAFYFHHDFISMSIAPILFTIMNYFSYRFNLIKIMERDDQSIGTILFPIALFILANLGLYFNNETYAILSILLLGYGDGLAAIIGKKFGRIKILNSDKSYIGSLTFFMISLIIYIFSFKNVHMIDFIIGISFALTLTTIEFSGKNGFDNLMIPIASYLLMIYFDLVPLNYLNSILLLLTIIFLIFGFIKKSITLDALIHAIAIAFFFIYIKAQFVLFGLLLFFIIGSLVSKIGKDKMIIEEKIHQRSGARTYIQVYANAGLAIILSLISYLTGNIYLNYIAYMTFVMALSDTVASEIGMLSKKNPISIITFKPIEKGLSGGISGLGISASFFASVLLSIPFIWIDIQWFIISIIAGFINMLIDSYLGALLQVKYKSLDGFVTEKKHTKNQLIISGVSFINNDVVNIISILTTSLILLFIL